RECSPSTLELRHVPDMQLKAAIEAPSTRNGWSICNLSSSPYGRYFAFEPYCEPFGGNPAFREIFVWDTLQNRTDQLTSNTDANPDTWYRYPQKYARYKPFWFDQRTLMLGVLSETLHYSDGIVAIPNTIFARTELYHFDERKPAILLSNNVTAWAKNPASGLI